MNAYGLTKPLAIGARGAVLVAALLGLAANANADGGPVGGPYHDRDYSDPGPRPLGISGSSSQFLVIGGVDYCCTGTFGAVVENAEATVRYLLSNNHVLARENTGATGEVMVQPGLYDNCTPVVANEVATLTDFEPLVFSALPRGKANNVVDAAIAEILSGSDFDQYGEILDIGVIAPTTAPASLDMIVMKSGRTSGYTTGIVAAVDVKVTVQYLSGYGIFSNQILLVGDGGPFIRPGDSGSLMVTNLEDGSTHAVGLLFAGSDTFSLANPIDEVLAALNVNMLGCAAATCASGGGGGGGKGGGGKGGGKKPKFAGGGAVGLETASQVKARHDGELFSIPGVVGTGIGVDDAGNAVIEVYVTNQARRAVGRPIPDELEGFQVRVVETGAFRAF